MSDANLPQYRVNRNLLNPNFEGYKLSLETFPSKTLKLPQNTYRPTITQGQYSLLHQHLFVNHNFLYHNIWQKCEAESGVFQCFTVLRDGGIYSVTFLKASGNFQMEKVFEMDVSSISQDNERERYNATISLASPDYAFVSNGYDSLTLCGVQGTSWKVLFCDNNILDGAPFTIVDSVAKSTCIGEKDVFILECLLKTVVKCDSKPTFENKFCWITFHLEDTVWKLQRKRVFIVKDPVEYGSLSRTGNASTVCLLHSGEIKFVSDSLKPVIENLAMEASNGSSAGIFNWCQSDDEVFITLNLNAKIPKSDINVNLTDNTIEVSIAGLTKSESSGRLFSRIVPDSSEWKLIGDETLQIRLVKAEKGQIWTNGIISGSSNVVHSNDPVIDRTASESCMDYTIQQEDKADPFNSRPAFNAEDIEECDMPCSDGLSLTWLNGESHKVFRTVDFGGHQWLFSSRVLAAQPPYIGLRYDVDGILWRIPSDPLSPDSSTPSAHSVTFDAFGYVEAAKESRRLVACSPGSVYAVIADNRRNVYIYWRNSELNGELRNRKTGQTVQSVCKQNLITIDADQEILGLVALDDLLIVLTDSTLNVFILSSSEVN